MRLYSREVHKNIVGKDMSSIVIEEAQIISNEKWVATADLAQHKNQLPWSSERKRSEILSCM